MRYPYAEIPADIAANIAARGGTPFNLYKVLANAPKMLGAWIDFAWTLRAECRTSRVLRELMILRTAQMQKSAYEWHQHRIMARNAGVMEEQVAELAMWRFSSIFDAPTRAALALTETLVNGENVDDATHAELAKHFDREECLELTLTAAFYCCVARVLGAIAVTADGEK